MEARTRQSLIFVKATANAQRRQREQLLHELPPQLAGPLATAPCLYFPDTEEVLRRFLPVTAAGIGTPIPSRPPGYSFREVGWAEKAVALLRQAGAAAGGKGYLLLRPPAAVEFQGRVYKVPELPVFRVDFAWAAGLLEQLWPFARTCLALVGEDMARGAVVDSYLGILSEDPNPAEVVFEVAVW